MAELAQREEEAKKQVATWEQMYREWMATMERRVNNLQVTNEELQVNSSRATTQTNRERERERESRTILDMGEHRRGQGSILSHQPAAIKTQEQILSFQEIHE